MLGDGIIVHKGPRGVPSKYLVAQVYKQYSYTEPLGLNSMAFSEVPYTESSLFGQSLSLSMLHTPSPETLHGTCE